MTACGPCNRRKGNRTPIEAGLRLLSDPSRPRYIALVLLDDARQNAVWEKYLY